MTIRSWTCVFSLKQKAKVCTDSHVSHPSPASVPWLRQTDLGHTGMERHRDSDREVASSIITPVAAPLSSHFSCRASLRCFFFPGCWGKLCWASPARWTMKMLSFRPPPCLTSGSMELSGITNLHYTYRRLNGSPYTVATLRNRLCHLLSLSWRWSQITAGPPIICLWPHL